MHPVLFHLGPLEVRSYGVMIVLGFALAVWWSMRVAPRYRIDPEQILDFVLLTALAGVIGARVVYVALDWHNFAQEPWRVLYFWEGGLSFHGAVIGGGLAVALLAQRKGIPFLQLADVLAPGVALAYSVGRIGCFLGGCCYGVPTDLPWACSFQDPFRPHVHTPPSHPTQIYASLSNLLIFALLARMQKPPHPAGKVFWAYITLYGVYRFLVEFWRVGATSTVLALGLSDAQWISILMVLLGGTGWVRAKFSEKVARMS
ncbi:MAG: prolipoprotein diacylglyceryl transferase [Armatimonadota bacterium]|nr:MAG: prolipoprotein diacylglyceryl transferase [Armatimonadota bacterium]